MNLGKLCPPRTKFIYISTDNVFDGSKEIFDELDQTNPTNVYGETKLKGELVVLENLRNSLIIRTNIFMVEFT